MRHAEGTGRRPDVRGVQPRRRRPKRVTAAFAGMVLMTSRVVENILGSLFRAAQAVPVHKAGVVQSYGFLTRCGLQRARADRTYLNRHGIFLVVAPLVSRPMPPPEMPPPPPPLDLPLGFHCDTCHNDHYTYYNGRFGPVRCRNRYVIRVRHSVLLSLYIYSP